jgi:hypothetical protein
MKASSAEGSESGLTVVLTHQVVNVNSSLIDAKSSPGCGQPGIRSVWQVDDGQIAPRLITAYVGKTSPTLENYNQPKPRFALLKSLIHSRVQLRLFRDHFHATNVTLGKLLD